METENKETENKETENEKEEISTSTFREILWNVRYNLKDEMMAMIVADEFNKEEIMKKAEEIRQVNSHVNACYGIGKFSLSIKSNS
tara:strand:+ start:279 stop:536 length:258 start_codon:yes stop_codon:yes gene_type:complete